MVSRAHYLKPFFTSLLMVTLFLGGIVGCTQQKPDAPQPATNPGPSTAKPDSSSNPTNDPSTTTSTEAESWIVPVTLGKSWDELDNPAGEGWDTEVFSSKANKQLKLLGEQIVATDSVNRNALAQIASTKIDCGPLVPGQQKTVYEDKALQVVREDDLGKSTANGHNASQGIDSLAKRLEQVRQQMSGATEQRFYFKLFRVEKKEDAITTTQYFSLSGRTPQGVVEQHATWTMDWKQAAGEKAPRITSIRMKDFQKTVTRSTDKPLFVDCTESALGKNASYHEQLLRGMNHWNERAEDATDLSMFGTPGMAVADVNNDGLADFYLCQKAGLPNRLYLQNPDGSMRDATAGSGADWLQDSRSALLIDLNNDGHQDLAVLSPGALIIASGDGQGHFQLRDALAVGQDIMSLTAADYDNDSRVDLYACVYNRDAELQEKRTSSIVGSSEDFVYHDANNAGSNALYRNEITPADGWKFREVTTEVGLNENNRRFSFASGWEDIDNDGDQDLYVANDFGRNNLYRNDRTADGKVRFVDIAAEANAEDSAAGMGVAWGDFNRDGRMDLYVSNMFSAAGNRITFQQAFKPDASEEVRTRLQRFARGNTLLENIAVPKESTGELVTQFQDVSESADVTMGRWAWTSSFVDINNDGWEDLLVANGYVTAGDTGDL